MHHPSTSTNQISLKSKKLFVDVRMDGQVDGHLRPTLLGRLGGVDLNSHNHSHRQPLQYSAVQPILHSRNIKSIKSAGCATNSQMTIKKLRELVTLKHVPI